MPLILNFLRTLLAEPIRDLRSMLDAGQPTNDIDMMKHAIDRLRDTGETQPGGLIDGSLGSHDAEVGAISPDPFPGVSQARLIRGSGPTSSHSD